MSDSIRTYSAIWNWPAADDEVHFAAHQLKCSGHHLRCARDFTLSLTKKIQKFPEKILKISYSNTIWNLLVPSVFISGESPYTDFCKQVSFECCIFKALPWLNLYKNWKSSSYCLLFNSAYDSINVSFGRRNFESKRRTIIAKRKTKWILLDFKMNTDERCTDMCW